MISAVNARRRGCGDSGVDKVARKNAYNAAAATRSNKMGDTRSGEEIIRREKGRRAGTILRFSARFRVFL